VPDEAPEQRPEPLAPPPRRTRRRSAADKVRAARFPVAMRGYDRAAVDSWRQEIADLVERLEEQQPREAAVKRALDEVGHETASILQRAHEAAEEITARSRSQAEGRLRRAEADADSTLREAEERVQQLETDTQLIWEQRARLIEEMRQLADEVLGVADDALERLAPPAAADAGEDTAETEESPSDGDTAQGEADDSTVAMPAGGDQADRPSEPR